MQGEAAVDNEIMVFGQDGSAVKTGHTANQNGKGIGTFICNGTYSVQPTALTIDWKCPNAALTETIDLPLGVTEDQLKAGLSTYSMKNLPTAKLTNLITLKKF